MNANEVDQERQAEARGPKIFDPLGHVLAAEGFDTFQVDSQAFFKGDMAPSGSLAGGLRRTGPRSC